VSDQFSKKLALSSFNEPHIVDVRLSVEGYRLLTSLGLLFFLVEGLIMQYRCRLNTILLAIFTTVWLAPILPAQIQDEIRQKNIDLAESLVADLIVMPESLSDRWAARQQRVKRNTIDLIAKKGYHESRVEEVWASDRKKSLVYTRSSLVNRDITGDQEVGDGDFGDPTVLIRTMGAKEMIKVGAEPWSSTGFQPRHQANSSFPLNWAIGFLNSATTGSMRKTEYMKNVLVGLGRTCLEAYPDKSGNFVTYWGRDGEVVPDAYAQQVVFSKKDGLTISYACLKFKKVVNRASILKGDFDKVEHGSVEWKSFPRANKNGKAMMLPVRVEVLSVMNEGQEIECVNEITWKFGKDVPDSVFVDPQVGEIIEPDFDK
jgi:hypothetical protein